MIDPKLLIDITVHRSPVGATATIALTSLRSAIWCEDETLIQLACESIAQERAACAMAAQVLISAMYADGYEYADFAADALREAIK